MSTKIACSTPFHGPPIITTPAVYGSSPNKPFLWRISVLGERPIAIKVTGLPSGLTQYDNIISGVTSAAGTHTVSVEASNRHGKATKQLQLHIEDDYELRLPLLGFTTWNAYGSTVTQEDVTAVGDYLVSSGLVEYGYNYVNLDSSWQGIFDSASDAVLPNSRFPDMKEMYSHLHKLGLKGGIYSSPFLKCWGCPKDMDYIPGCTTGTPDPRFPARFPDVNGGIGMERHEQGNVRQWDAWGVDYLKYDWTPTDVMNAELMKRALVTAKRQISFCVTVHASTDDYEFLNKNCCSWRSNEDTTDLWENLLMRMDTVDIWRDKTSAGHFLDLDMLAIGPMQGNDRKCRLTEDEEKAFYTFHAFFPSPIQLSMIFSEMTEFERDLIANEEIIAVNQDELCDFPVPVELGDGIRAWKRKLASGDTALAVFNISDTETELSLSSVALDKIRDLWRKVDLSVDNTPSLSLPPHSAEMIRFSPCQRQ